ncbi:MAG: flippase [Candidatus Pacearchaeota archaeon]|nr:flippase [Candidatus Pacearchaeota archaeon]
MNSDKLEIDKSLSILASSAVIVLIGMILSKIFSYIYRIMIARVYGPEVYGLFLLASSIIGLLIFFVLLGFDSGIVRFIPIYLAEKKIKNIRFLVNLGFYSSIILGVIFGAILFLSSTIISISIFHNSALIFFLKIFSILVPIMALTNYSLAIINGYEKIKLFSFIENIWRSGMNVLFLVFLILLGIGANSVPLSFLLAGISTLIISVIAVYKYTLHSSKENLDKLEINEKRKARKEFIHFSIPLLFFNIISVLMGWIDSLFIGYFKTATEVGVYNSAVPIALLLYIAPQLFTKLFLPMVSREYGRRKIEVIKQLTQQVGKWILLINLPIFLVLFLFPENFINLLFGAEFTSAGTALRILIINALFLSVCRVSNRLLTMAGKTKTILIDIIIAVIVNIILNTILIPMPFVFGIENSSGINGAAIATTIASILIGALFLIQANKTLSILPLRRKMLNIILAGIIAAIFTIIISKFIKLGVLGLIMTAIFLGLSYLVLIFLFKGLDKNDFFILRKFMRKFKISKK